MRGVMSPGRLVAALLSALVVLYAAALRLEALTAKYNPVERPAWLRAVQTDTSSAIRPLRPAGSSTGRLLLIVLATSLIPFSLTWPRLPDWRFTEHAYPFFLLAACAVPWQALAFVRRIRHSQPEGRVRARTLAFWTAVCGAVGVAWWLGTRVLPVQSLWYVLVRPVGPR
jgi:hypothetical protein